MDDQPNDIFIAKNGQQLGPFSESQVREAIAKGFISPVDLCWKTGKAEWVPIGNVILIDGFVMATPVQQQFPVQQYAQPGMPTTPPKSSSAYMILAFFLGSLGIHNFYAGYTGKAVAQLLLTIILSETIIVPIAIWIWAIIEGCSVRKDSNGVPFS